MKSKRESLPALPRRGRNTHKGDFGRVLVIGGSRGMVGAPALVANAALRSGAGLVTVACPEAIQLAVAGLCPCATSLPLAEDLTGRVDFRAAARALRRDGYLGAGSAATVAAIGPGLGRGDARSDTLLTQVMELLASSGVPLVIDADALNALPVIALEEARGRGKGARIPRLGRAVLTPHPGEMARLAGLTTKAVQGDRRDVAVRLQKALSRGGAEVVIVLKGAGTIIAGSGRVAINTTGNPGMATGGSGDVLTGVIAGLIAQGMSLYDAARLGAHIHGLAGDLVAKELGGASLIATDILTQLPDAFQRVGR